MIDFVPDGAAAGGRSCPCRSKRLACSSAGGSGARLACAAPAVAAGVASVVGRVAFTRMTRWPCSSGAVISTVSRNSAGSKDDVDRLADDAMVERLIFASDVLWPARDGR